jgi:hypothetical protein
VVQPFLDAWRGAGPNGLALYEAGSEGPNEANQLLARDAGAGGICVSRGRIVIRSDRTANKFSDARASRGTSQKLSTPVPPPEFFPSCPHAALPVAC